MSSSSRDDDDNVVNSQKSAAATQQQDSMESSESSSVSSTSSHSQQQQQQQPENNNATETTTATSETADDDDNASSYYDSSASDSLSTNSGDEDDDDDDDDPPLRYSRLGGSLKQIFAKGNCASALCVAERFLALGTHLGYLYILDFEGNIVKAAEKKLALRPHTESINDICTDASGEYVASCSNDGRVVVTHLYGKDSYKMEFAKPMKAVAIDPHYARKNDKPVACGGKTGKMIVTKKGWFKTKQLVLEEGEGTIHAVKWHKRYLTWATDNHIKFFDVANERRIAKVPRNKTVSRADMFRCCIQWVSNDPYGDDDDGEDEKLIIGWGKHVDIAILKDVFIKETGEKKKSLSILSQFDFEFYICGLVPYQRNIMILAYEDDMSDEDDVESDSGSFEAPPPSLMIIDSSTGRETTQGDQLTIEDYHKYFATDYRLEYHPMESSYYILSQKAIVVAHPKDADDRIDYLLSRERYSEALTYAKEHESELTRHTLNNLGKSNLNYLISKGEFNQAAEEVPKIAGHNKKTWEHWIYEFVHRKQLKALLKYIPTENPQLDSKFYEMILNEFLDHELDSFHRCIENWPQHLYKPAVVINRVLQHLTEMQKSQEAAQAESATPGGLTFSASGSNLDLANDSIYSLKKSLAKLYQHDGQYDKTLNIYFELRTPTFFDYIRKHNLFHFVRDKVSQLLDFDDVEAHKLLVNNTDQIPPANVVEQLKDEENEGKTSLKRQQLMKYLHNLQRKEIPQVQPYHLLLVKLYAENDTNELCRFLNNSQSYNIDSAFEICEMYLSIHQNEQDKRNLYKALVFLYGRMGNNQQALQIITDQLADVDLAIEFVKDHADDSELWQDLISHSLKNGKFISGLLDHIGEYIGEHINPQTLIREIPDEMEIDDLKKKLTKIISDYSLQTTLQERTQEILLSDIRKLSLSLYQKQRRGVRVSHVSKCMGCNQGFHPQNPSKMFFCGHMYHTACYERICEEANLDLQGEDRCIFCDQQESKQHGSNRRRRRR